MSLDRSSCAPLFPIFNDLKSGAEAGNAAKNGAEVGNGLRTGAEVKESLAPISGKAHGGVGADYDPLKNYRTGQVETGARNPTQTQTEHLLPDWKNTQDSTPHEPKLPDLQSNEPKKPPPESEEPKKPPPEKPGGNPENPHLPPATTAEEPAKVTLEVPKGDLPPYPTDLPGRFREYWRQFTTVQALSFISKYGTPEMKEWASGNNYVKQAVELTESETWLGHVATKYLRIDPKWRIKYDSTAFGREGLTGKITKGWNKMWGEKTGAKKSVEKAMKILVSPIRKPLMAIMSGISKAVDKIRSAYLLKFLNWAKMNSLPNIRATIPNFGLKGEKPNPAYQGPSFHPSAESKPAPSTVQPEIPPTHTDDHHHN